MRNLLLTLEWHGGGFHGWQFQPNQRTVQGELESALETLLRHPVTLTGAGRTDAGVHALAMTANFKTESEMPEWKIARALNGITGADLTVTAVREVGIDFSARFSCVGRHYIYLLLRERSALWEDRALWHRQFPDIELMNRAAAALPGQHDFAAFSCRSEDENGTESLVYYARWEVWERGLAFRIGAIRFLYKMVRCLVANSLAVGVGKIAPETFSTSLIQPAGRGELIAPAQGLYFVAGDYEINSAQRRWGPDCLPDWPVL